MQSEQSLREALTCLRSSLEPPVTDNANSDSGRPEVVDLGRLQRRYRGDTLRLGPHKLLQIRLCGWTEAKVTVVLAVTRSAGGEPRISAAWFDIVGWGD